MKDHAHDNDGPTKVKFNAVKTFHSLHLIQRRSTESNCSAFHRHFIKREKRWHNYGAIILGYLFRNTI